MGIEEDEEDVNIYGGERMSDYDMSLGDEPDDLHKFTKPSGLLVTNIPYCVCIT